MYNHQLCHPTHSMLGRFKIGGAAEFASIFGTIRDSIKAAVVSGESQAA